MYDAVSSSMYNMYIQMRIYISLLPPFHLQSVQNPAFIPPSKQEPYAADPTQNDAYPRMHWHLEMAEHEQLEGSSGESDEIDRERRRGLGEEQRRGEHGPAAYAAAYGEEPEERHVQEVAVVQDVTDFAGEQDDRGED